MGNERNNTTESAAQSRDRQVKRIWRRFLLLIPLIAVLALASYAVIKVASDTYEIIGFTRYGEAEFEAAQLELSETDVVQVASVERTSLGTVHATLNAIADGVTTVSFGIGDARETWQIEVRDGSIIEDGINFSGWEAVYASLCIFLAATIALFASALRRLYRRAWFGYEMVACGGGLLFCLFQLVFFLGLLLLGGTPSLRQFLQTLSSTAEYFVLLSFFPMALLALLVSASNISLIRHEGLRPVNLLGIAFSVVWAVTNVVLIVLGSTWSGVEFASCGLQYANSLVMVGIAFGECLLVSTMLCAWLAAHHAPQHAMDYLVVLGCGIRADGKPLPLLAGRIDRALAFDAQCVEAGEAPATFVPSGGQGPDEPISEAESMEHYLEDKGVAPERIVLEDRSSTTNENMAFSRTAIEKHAHRSADELRVGFSTTNYHVFRGYVCAHKAGMEVEGMGSKTKYYFWPNAFLREFAGLIVGQWKPIVQTYCIIALVHLFTISALTLV